MIRLAAPWKFQWTFYFRACTAWRWGQPVFAVEGGKNWSSTFYSPKHVYDSHQKSDIRHEESGHCCNSFRSKFHLCWWCFEDVLVVLVNFKDKKSIFNISVLVKTIHDFDTIASLLVAELFSDLFSFLFRLADSSIRRSTSSHKVLPLKHRWRLMLV